jgi:hypothetical protein
VVVGPSAVRQRSAHRGVGCRRMNIHLSLAPLIALIAGILILIMPKLLNFIVAIYLILIGVIGILGTHGFHI